MAIKERLEHLNALRVTNGENPLKSWSKSGAALEERISSLTTALAAKGGETPESPNAPVTKNRGLTIASAVRPLILNTELTNQQIFDKIEESHPGLLGEKRKWYVAWYRGDLRRKAERGDG